MGPVVALVVGRLIGMSGLGLQSLVLAFAMPTAVNVFMQAREYESDADTVAAIVAISSLVGIVTISVVVTNLAMFV